VDAEVTVADLATMIDAAEARVRAAVPAARVIYVEPDLDRGMSEPPALGDVAPHDMSANRVGGEKGQ
jgi:hypothetical protein